MKTKLQRLRRRWLTIPWGWRWLIWTGAVVGSFYGVENTRGDYALQRYIEMSHNAGEWFEPPEKQGVDVVELLAEGYRLGHRYFSEESESFDTDTFKGNYGPRSGQPIPFDAARLGADELTKDYTAKAAAAEYLRVAVDHAGLDYAIESINGGDYASQAYSDRGAGQINELDMSFALIRGLKHRSAAHVQCGEGSAALEDIVASLRYSKYLQNRPGIIKYLAATAYCGISLTALWEGLAAKAWDRQQLELIAAALADYPPPSASNERLYLNLRAEAWEDRSLTIDLSSRMEHGLWFRPVDVARLPNYLHFIQEWIDNAIVYAPSGWYKLWWIQEQERNRADLLPTSPRLDQRWYFSIWQMERILPVDGLMNVQRRLEANLRMAQIATAMECYRLHAGYYATSIQELVPTYLEDASILVDPFSGKLFIYLPLSGDTESPLIYSVGKNGSDDSGKYKHLSSSEDDILWYLSYK